MHDSRRDCRERVVVAKLDFLKMRQHATSPSEHQFASGRSVGLTETETVSFSLTMGTTPMWSSSEKVFWALRYRVRCKNSAQ